MLQPTRLNLAGWLVWAVYSCLATHQENLTLGRWGGGGKNSLLCQCRQSPCHTSHTVSKQIFMPGFTNTTTKRFKLKDS